MASLPLLHQALTMTQEMLVLAEAGEWEQIGAMDQRRLSLLKEAVAPGISDEEKMAVIPLIQEIQALTTKLMQQAASGKAELAKAMQLMHKQKDAALAYTACQQTLV